MKKIISLMMIVALVIATMTACTSQTSGSGSTKIEDNAISKASSSEAQERVEFEFYSGIGGDMANVLQEIIDDFNASQDQFFCNHVSYSSYDEVFRAYQAAAAKQHPAMINADRATVERLKGTLADVSQFADEDQSFTWDEYIPVHLLQCYDGDQIVMLPFNAGGWLLFYDKHKIVELGLDPDVIFADWEAVGEMAAEVTQRDENGNVTYWAFQPIWYYTFIESFGISNGGKILSDDRKTALVNTPEWVEPLKLMRQWLHEDETIRMHHGGTGWEAWYKGLDDVMEGRALASIGSSGDGAYMEWDKVGVTQIPNLRGKGTWAGPVGINVLAVSGAVPVEQQRGAFQLWKFYSSAENQAKFSMETGYFPVNRGSFQLPTYIEFMNTSMPSLPVLLEINENGSFPFIHDEAPKITEILGKAYDRVMIEGVQAQQAMDEAKAEIEALLG